MSEPTRRSRAVSLSYLAVLTAHGTLAGIALWLLPGGFPMSHQRFWLNRVIPSLILIVAAAGIAIRRHRPQWLETVIAMITFGWMAGAVAAHIVFPISFHVAFVVPLIVGIKFVMVVRPSWWRSVPFLLVGTMIGAVVPWQARGPVAGTTPLNAKLPAMPDGAAADLVHAVKPDERVSVQPRDGMLTFRCGPRVMVTVDTLLTFYSRSPDRCWTIFAPPEERRRPPRVLQAAALTEGRFQSLYHDLGITSLRIDQTGLSTDVEAMTQLKQPVYSHLNSYCELGFFGHKKLRVEFSPCPGKRIDFVPSDYPAGRPQRSAYVDSSDSFHVVEARSAEKGPFRDLAVGKLARDVPLKLTLFDEDRPLLRLTFADFAAQADRTLSPTAGWGLPTNAIEFSLYGEKDSSQAGLTMTLAGTSVGRGWDAVGHAAGTYRNRVMIQRFDRP